MVARSMRQRMSPAGLSLALVLIVIAALAAATAWLAITRRQLVADVNRYSLFLEHGPFLAYLKDADGRYIFENEAVAEHMARVRPGTTTTLGRTDQELFPTLVGSLYVDHDRSVIEGGQPHQFAEMSVDADGTVRHWSSMKFPWRDDRGRPCIAGISIDVSALQQARTEARSSEDRCALALEAGRMGTLTLNLETQMLDTSPLFALLHGRPETKTHLSLAESLAEVHPDDRQSILDAVQAALRNRAPSRITYRVVRADGAISWIELMGQVYADETGRPSIVRGVGFDVTERQEAYEELARRKQVLRRLIEVQENERQTLCHELHDGMMQYAIGAAMLLEAVRDEAKSPTLAERIDMALDSLNRGIAEGRQVIRGVRSAVLDDLGLAPAIQDLADQMANAGVTVETTLDERLNALPAALQTTVYRVVQESLTNVRKHAAVDRASVAIIRTPIDVHLQVSDAGTGFDVIECRRQGFGLVGMTERVRLAGGTCLIESQPGRGTRIDVRLPIPAVENTDLTPAQAPLAYAAADPDAFVR